MRLSLRVAIVVTLAAVALSLIACDQDPWKSAEDSLGVLARDVADRAERNDVKYFEGLTPDPEKVPDLIAQIASSGIASNYAEHLVVETDDSASLVYGETGDLNSPAAFAVRLSLVDGQPQVWQFFSYREEDEDGNAGAFRPPNTTPSSRASEIGTVSVQVTLPSKLVVARSESSALISFTNSSDESIGIPRPFDGVIRIVDVSSRTVSEWELNPNLKPTDAVVLAPWETIYHVVTFEAPESGGYRVQGYTNGVWAPAISLQAID